MVNFYKLCISSETAGFTMETVVFLFASPVYGVIALNSSVLESNVLIPHSFSGRVFSLGEIDQIKGKRYTADL